MNVEYSKAFIREVKKLNGKELQSVGRMIQEAKKAKNTNELTDCIKLSGYKNIFRIRIGDHRVFFYIKIINNSIFFQYIVSRGEAYKKKMKEKLQEKDKEIQDDKNKG